MIIHNVKLVSSMNSDGFLEHLWQTEEAWTRLGHPCTGLLPRKSEDSRVLDWWQFYLVVNKTKM